ncbi:hypothetical protein THAOC_22968, partial [Thalassiosira oceanica]
LADELASLHQEEPHEHETFEEGRKQRARERKRLRQELQQNQPAGTSYWSEHSGQGQARPTARQYPEGFKGQMYPTKGKDWGFDSGLQIEIHQSTVDNERLVLYVIQEVNPT